METPIPSIEGFFKSSRLALKKRSATTRFAIIPKMIQLRSVATPESLMGRSVGCNHPQVLVCMCVSKNNSNDYICNDNNDNNNHDNNDNNNKNRSG